MTRAALLASLLQERFTSPWWHTAIRPDVDDELNCGTRRQTLRDALAGYDDEEVPDGSVEEVALRDPAPRQQHLQVLRGLSA